MNTKYKSKTKKSFSFPANPIDANAIFNCRIIFHTPQCVCMMHAVWFSMMLENSLANSIEKYPLHQLWVVMWCDVMWYNGMQDRNASPLIQSILLYYVNTKFIFFETMSSSWKYPYRRKINKSSKAAWSLKIDKIAHQRLIGIFSSRFSFSN